MTRPCTLFSVLAFLAFLVLSCSDSDSNGVLIKTKSRGSPTEGESPSGEEPTVVTRPPRKVSLSYLADDRSVPELPPSIPAPVLDRNLADLIQEALADREGSYSVVVRHLITGRAASFNADAVYYAASVFKVALLYEAYLQRDAGQIDFDQELTLEQRHVEYDLGTLAALDLIEGDIITLGDALKAMIVVSDTPTAALIQETLGFRQDETLQALGITATQFNNRELPTTARDMAILLEVLALGIGLQAESREQMLSLLLQEQFRDRLPALLPEDASVAHKTGNAPTATHDIGIVWGPSGAYIIVALSDQPWTPEPIAELSRRVYDYFAESS